MPTAARWSLPIQHISIARALLILEAHYEGVYEDRGARVVPIQDALADVLAEVQIRYFVDLRQGTPAPPAQLQAGLPVEWVDLVYPVHAGPGRIRRAVCALPLAVRR